VSGCALSGCVLTELSPKDTVDVMNTGDEWYRKRYREVISKPEKYTQWKVLDGQLYVLRPKPVVSEIVESRLLEAGFAEGIT